MASQKIAKLTLTLVIATLLISACAGVEPSPTPTAVSLDAIYTAAAATIFAGETGTAGAQPTKTVTPTNTTTPTGTVTGTPVATRAVVVFVQPVVIMAATTQTGTPGTLAPSITPTFGAVGCNNSTLVQDVAVPNMKAGENFTKTWKIQNTGTCAWNTNFKFTFIGGNVLDSDTTKIRTTVEKGGTYTRNLGFIAPTAPGTYTGYWRMADDTGLTFGEVFSVVVYVPGATFTPTSAVTDTPVTPTQTTAPTAVPTTAVPATAVPTTAVPATAVPTTAVPTTAVPTTAVPTVTPTPTPG